MSGTHSFKKKTFARPHIISFLQPLCLINYYFFHNTVIFSTTLHFSKALSKPSLRSEAASTQILPWFIFPGTFSSLTDIKRARVLNIHIHIKKYIYIFLAVAEKSHCLYFFLKCDSLSLFCAVNFMLRVFPRATTDSAFPLICHLIHSTTSGFLNNGDF